MDLKTVAPIIVAALTLLGVVLQLTRNRESGIRTTLKTDLDLLSQLRKDSAAHDALREHIETRVVAMTEHEQTARRDPYGVAWGVIFLLVAVGIVIIAATYRGWLWFLLILELGAIPFAIFALATSMRKRIRDDKGTEIQHTSDGD